MRAADATTTSLSRLEMHRRGRAMLDRIWQGTTPNDSRDERAIPAVEGEHVVGRLVAAVHPGRAWFHGEMGSGSAVSVRIWSSAIRARRSTPSTVSASTSSAGRSSACSGRTAPGRRRRSACSRRACGPRAARAIGRRRRRRARPGARPQRARGRPAAQQPRPRALDPRQPHLPRRLPRRAGAAERNRARRRAARAVRAARAREAEARHVLRRPGAARDDRAGADARAGGALPRRAVDRARPGRAAVRLGPAARAARRAA